MSMVNRVALITGACGGIGSGTAVHLATLGYQLALSDRSEEKFPELTEKCANVGLTQDKVLQISGDITDDNIVKTVVNKTVEKFGRLDVLVNNVGVLAMGTLEKMEMDDFDLLFKTNLRSQVLLTKLAAPHLEKTKGAIVNVSSVHGLRANPNVLAYSVLKAALDQFTRCTALELATKQVRVNAVNPGSILTEIQYRMQDTWEDGEFEQYLNRIGQNHALGRIGTVDEVARTIGFLASDAASFITGATIPVDGGRHAMCPR